MKNIDTQLTSRQKLDIAKNYGTRLFNEYPTIESIIISGSVVRGNDIPVSDVDMWYITKKESQPLPIQKGIHHGVYLDIEPYYLEDLEISTILKNAYVLGYLKNSLTLCDRYGEMAALKKRIEEEPEKSSYTHAQLAAIHKTAVRNLHEFAAAVKEKDEREICRSAIFALWCFSEYLLVKHDQPPGGFRCLSRLKMVNTDAFLKCITFQDSLAKESSRLGEFYHIYAKGKNTESYDFQKYVWMNHHGFKDEAFHMLWILFGLEIKEEREGGCHEIAVLWLEELAWDETILHKKVLELQGLFRTHNCTKNLLS